MRPSDAALGAGARFARGVEISVAEPRVGCRLFVRMRGRALTAGRDAQRYESEQREQTRHAGFQDSAGTPDVGSVGPARCSIRVSSRKTSSAAR